MAKQSYLVKVDVVSLQCSQTGLQSLTENKDMYSLIKGIRSSNKQLMQHHSISIETITLKPLKPLKPLLSGTLEPKGEVGSVRNSDLHQQTYTCGLQ